MRVLIINSVCGIRSTGRIATDIAKEYMAEGHTCRIAYGREDVPEEYREISYRIGSEWNVRVNALKARVFDNEGFNAKTETKKFIAWANNYNPDLVWIHNIHGYYIHIDLLFDWIKRRPQMQVKWTLHDCWAFTGHCSHFSFVRCYKWREQCSHCVQKKEYPKAWLLDRSRNNFVRKQKAFCGVKDMTIITPSQWLADLVKKSFLKDYNVEVHYNTIDLDVFKPTPSDFRERFGLENKKIVLGVASAWNARKGIYDFSELSERLNPDYVVVLVGVPESQIHELSDKILCLPRTNSSQELAEIYSAADVFVNLTYEDTYPTVNLEAQACGTTCLTYRTGGSVENVSKENVVEQGDISEMISKIQIVCGKKV